MKKNAEGRKFIYNFILILLLGVAVIFDFRTWKIPNKLVLVGLVIGLLGSVFQRGVAVGLRFSLTGNILPIFFLISLFWLKVIGGGDIKLFSMLGSYVGADIIYIMIISFIFGGVLSVFYILRHFCFKAIYHSRYSGISTEMLNLSKGNGRIHFSLAILAGAIYYIFFL